MMRLAVSEVMWRPKRRTPARGIGARALVVCPRCGHSRRRFRHRGSCVKELQVIYDPDGVPCGCTDEFHS